MADRCLTITVCIALAGFPALLAVPALAQSEPAVDATEQAARKAEFDSISQEIAVTQERQAALGLEITTLATDRTALNRTLIETGDRAKALERKISNTENRMQKLRASESKLRDSLAQRRAVLAEVLAALQRMGRHPPPAIVVRPEDALSSVRSAILLGSVVPDLRVRAEAVAIDLHDLVVVREQLDGERERLRSDAGALAEERARIGLMIEAKKRAQSESEQALATERQKASDLAKKADNLKDLITSVEKQLAAASEAAEKARKADEVLQAATPMPTSLGSSDRIAPAVAFVDAKGLLPKPVNGVDMRGFGEDDGVGGKSQGLSIATRSAAQVTTPADG